MVYQQSHKTVPNATYHHPQVSGYLVDSYSIRKTSNPTWSPVNLGPR